MAKKNDTKPETATAAAPPAVETKPETATADIVLPSAPEVPPELRKERRVPSVAELVKDNPGMTAAVASGIVAREQALFDGRSHADAELAYARAVVKASAPKAEPRVGEAPRVDVRADRVEAPALTGFVTLAHADPSEKFTKTASKASDGTVLLDDEQIFTGFDGAKIGARPNVNGKIILKARMVVDNIMPGEVFGERPEGAYRLVMQKAAALLDPDQMKIVELPDPR